MKCSVYIATSADGFIARNDGSVDWLENAGKPDVDLGDDADMGMNAFMASIDCLIMGRKSMEIIDSFNLTPEQWPYGNKRIIVLSRSLKEPPPGMKDKVELYSGDILQLLEKLENEGHQHAYVDGGQTIQSFIDLELIQEITITRIPVLLGEGIPLFGKTNQEIKLENCSAKVYPNDFIQEHFHVRYS